MNATEFHIHFANVGANSSLRKKLHCWEQGMLLISFVYLGSIFFLIAWIIKKITFLISFFNINKYQNISLFHLEIYTSMSITFKTLNRSKEKFRKSGNTTGFTYRWHFPTCYKPGWMVSKILQIVINCGKSSNWRLNHE